MNIALWSLQILLALAFLAAGTMKLLSPLDDLLANGMAWVGYTPAPLVRFIGLSELLGAIGLVIPHATRIQPWLTPLAAALLALVMVLAAGTHAVHGELDALPVNAVLGGLLLAVAWGRRPRAPGSSTSP